MKYNKILITGGCGFIGTNFINLLLKKKSKIKVINVDKLSYASNKYINQKYKNNKNYYFYKCNIGNVQKIKNIINKHKVDCIINFAAESHVDNSIVNPEKFLESNTLNSLKLLKLTINKNIHFHQISTDEVFGDLNIKSKRKFKITDNYNPSSPYSASKASFDLILKAFARTYGISYSISYCSNNYGPFQHSEKFIPKLIKNIKNGELVPIYGKGENIRDWIYVEDHCEGILLQLKKSRRYQIMMFGGNNKISNLDLSKKIIKIIKKNKNPNKYIKMVKDRPGHDLMYQVSNKLSSQMGWKPSNNLNQGINKTIKWYLEENKF